MKRLDDLLLLGNPLLYEVSEPVLESEMHLITGWMADLHNVMEEVRARYHFGRGIAAPQLGIMKRVIYINTGEPVLIINPELHNLSDDMFELWDDCMCLPNLLVKVKRHRTLTLKYRDENWEQCEWSVTDDLAELVQHEYDHLDGILCTMRAIDAKSFRWKS
jgi:peptide deformylase